MQVSLNTSLMLIRKIPAFSGMEKQGIISLISKVMLPRGLPQPASKISNAWGRTPIANPNGFSVTGAVAT
jgi:hypothetical protein